MNKNTLYYGDCLEVIQEWDDNLVDLIYLEPPCNSKANHNILFGTQRNDGDKNDLAQLTAFTDTWEWDAVFGKEQFRNEIIWYYKTGGTSPRWFARKHDIVFFYAKRNPFDFEKWAVTHIPGFAPNQVQRGDGGIDGRAMIHGVAKGKGLCISQVKCGKPSVDALKAFVSILAGGKAEMGIFITLEKRNTPTVKKCIAQSGTLTIGETQYNRLVMHSIDEHFQQIDPKLRAMIHARTGQPYHVQIPGQRHGQRPGKINEQTALFQ